MSKVLRFRLSGYVSIPVEDVVFTTSRGTSAKRNVVEKLSTEDLLDNINEGDLDFDWLSLAEHPGFNVGMEDLEVIEE